ncbi:hypothetical protein ACFL6M_01695 [Candidatus Eisenbacteria bacterium]|uniref:DUF2946 domain-containing protein n=1 Tax=Eiseniibacteriota bacterium TaxID=2212470 RepID=A0ABV6YIY3_UNCEI
MMDYRIMRLSRTVATTLVIVFLASGVLAPVHLSAAVHHDDQKPSAAHNHSEDSHECDCCVKGKAEEPYCDHGTQDHEPPAILRVPRTVRGLDPAVQVATVILPERETSWRPLVPQQPACNNPLLAFSPNPRAPPHNIPA